jgi:hypothetical protein
MHAAKKFSIEIEKKLRKLEMAMPDEIVFGDLKQMLNHQVLTAFEVQASCKREDKKIFCNVYKKNAF